MPNIRERYTRKMNDLVVSTEAEIKALQRDRSLDPGVKAYEISQIQEAARDEFARLHHEATSRLEADRRDAERRAHPPETASTDVAAELRLGRLKDEALAQWQGRGGGPTLAEYERALSTGDTDQARIIEVYGPAAVRQDEMRSQLTRRIEKAREDRMSPEQRQAREELSELENQTPLELGMALNALEKSAKIYMDRPAEDLASTRPGESVEKPGIAPQGSAFHEG